MWKLQAIPALLFGKQVVTLSKKIIEKIQKIENNMYRYLIGVGGTTPVATLRGEVGASSIESRVMETVLNFTRNSLQGKFVDVKSYMEHDLETGKGRWSKTVHKYRQELRIRYNNLKDMSKKEIKNKVRERDTKLWEENMEEKETLKWYRRGKKKIGYDMCYRNTYSSKLLARARTNTLQVEEFIHRRNRNHSKICRLCGRDEEDLKHFLINCPRLGSKRNRRIMEKWYNVYKDKQLINILFNEKDYDKVRKMVGAMWLLRKDLLRPP